MSSSHCVVPNWNNLRVSNKHQGTQDLSQTAEGNRSSHLDLDLDSDSHPFFHQGFSQIIPMPTYDITEITWKNGQLALHELGAMLPPPPPPRPSSSVSSSPLKPAWGGINRAGDTLESIVHQATQCNKQGQSQKSENVGSSGGKWTENWVGPVQNSIPPPPPPPPPGLIKKRSRSESEHCRVPNNDGESGCGSASGVFCRDNNNDTTMMTWASYESHRSCTRTKTTTDEDSACHEGSENHEEERETKGDTGRCSTTRKGRAAAVHNQSERRRRNRINQKMKALQKLVPNASKTDKASMLDEVIEYLKQLQSQVQMMSNARMMPQMMMSSLGMQQHLQQMSLLARMGMGGGLGLELGMLDPTSIGHNPTHSQGMPHLIHPTQMATASAFLPHGAFVVPQMMPQSQQPKTDPGPSSSAPLQDAYAALLAQSMNMDLFNRMAALQRQQQQQQTTAQQTSNQLHSNHAQGG